MRKIIRSLEISLFQNPHSAYKGKGHLRPHAPRQGKLYAALRFPPIGILLLRIKGRASPSPCTSTRKFKRSLEISFFEFIVLRITSGTSPSFCTTTGEFIRSLEISSFGILLLRIKRRDVSVPMYLDEENYTQP